MPIISRPGFFDSASIENLTIETQLLLQAASETYGVAISHSEQSADRTITIPALAGNGDMVITNAVQTLTNKTITNLKLSEILDTNGNELFKFTTTSSAVNEITLANAAASNAPVFSATGGDTNIDIKFDSYIGKNPIYKIPNKGLPFIISNQNSEFIKCNTLTDNLHRGDLFIKFDVKNK